MATFDLTAKSTTGVSADSNTNFPASVNPGAYVLEKELDIAQLVADGTFSNVTSGDVFQLLEIPANTIVVTAGANVTTEDVMASNGVIHVIDTVLIPPVPYTGIGICYNTATHTIVAGSTYEECNAYNHIMRSSQ